MNNLVFIATSPYTEECSCPCVPPRNFIHNMYSFRSGINIYSRSDTMATIYYTVPFVWLLLKGDVYSSVAVIPLASLLVATN